MQQDVNMIADDRTGFSDPDITDLRLMPASSITQKLQELSDGSDRIGRTSCLNVNREVPIWWKANVDRVI